MSIVIQKKKLGQNSTHHYLDEAAKHQGKDLIDEAYAKLFDDFLKSFRKAQIEASLNALKQALDKFYKKLKVNDYLLNDMSKHGENINNDSESNFILLKKATEVVNILSEHLLTKENLTNALNNPNIWKSPEKIDKLASEYREITFRCLKVIKLFTMVNPCFAIVLSNKPGFLTKMLELTLQNPKIYFKQALIIIEALIASNSNTITISTYPLILEILTNLPKKYFARFSRIIALMVLEPTDKIIFKELSYQFSESKLTRIHTFLLSVPEFVESYTLILEYLKQIMSTLMQINSENIQKIINELKESRLLKDSGLSLNVLKPLVEQYHISNTLASEIFSPKFITKIIIKKSNMTEILFILSNLLSSKRKVDVQNTLTEIGFFERVLNPLFDILFHPSLESDSPDGTAYSDECYCSNPLTTTRIQLLRIIINFCDRDSSNVSNKTHFLSSEENELLQNLILQGALKAHNANYKPAEGTFSVQEAIPAVDKMTLGLVDPDQVFFTEGRMKTNAFESVQEKGLLHKVIQLLNRVPSNSSYYFWLASCVESFLRGFYVPHQVFVAHTGMLYKLVKQIVTNEITRSNNVQISYDLLGEIVKFNKHNIVFLEYICRKFNWIDLLPEHALKNVVDSNVFFRSLWLSFEKFKNTYETQKKKENEVTQENFQEASDLCKKFIKQSPKWFNLLVEAVEPTLISQDNICCINTSLILAIFAEQRGELELYLNSLYQNEPKEKPNRDVLQNYKNVLSIWHRYYMLKTKDSFSLQYTSSLPFYSFQDMKEKLQYLLEKYLTSTQDSI